MISISVTHKILEQKLVTCDYVFDLRHAGYMRVDDSELGPEIKIRKSYKPREG